MGIRPILVGTMIAMLAIGCSSINCRTSTKVGEHALPHYVYPGTQCDVVVLVGASHSDEDPTRLNWLLLAIFLDLPFSFVGDTVCLPYDAYMVTCGRRHRNGAPTEVEHKPTTAPTMRSSEPPPADAAGGRSP
jgi:uncharacterized protein YceK